LAGWICVCAIAETQWIAHESWKRTEERSSARRVIEIRKYRVQ
jgi:hypothetical protein